MKAKNIFYVYEHWRPDKDECFYVGKGYGERANVLRQRGKHHASIQKKLSRLGMCVEVRLVKEALFEDEAFTLEIERIAFWRGLGIRLANITIGGTGRSGPPSAEHLAALKAAGARRRGIKVGPMPEAHKKAISAALKGKPKPPEQVKKIADAKRGKKHPPKTPEQRKAISERMKKYKAFLRDLKALNLA